MGNKKTATARISVKKSLPKRKPQRKKNSQSEPEGDSALEPPKPRPKPRALHPNAKQSSTNPAKHFLGDTEAAELLMGLHGHKNLSLTEEMMQQKQVDDWVLHQLETSSSKPDSTDLDSEPHSPIHHQSLVPTSRPHTSKEPTDDSSVSEESASDEAFDITYEVERDNVLHDFSLTSSDSFATFLQNAASVFGVSSTHLGSLGYIPSYLPKSPKPLPRLINSDETYEKMIEGIESWIEEAKSKTKGKKKVKAFSIRLIDTSGPTMKESRKKSKQGSKATESVPALSPAGSEEAIYKEIEQEHACDKHSGKTCFVCSNGSHYQYTTDDLSLWATLVKNRRAAYTEPPDPIVRNIEKKMGMQSQIKSRIRTPHAPPPAMPSGWNIPYPPASFMYSAPSMPPPGYNPFYSPFGHPTTRHSDHLEASPTSSPVSTPSKRPAMPRILEWLSSLDADQDRGKDELNYQQYNDILVSEGIIRLDDLVDLGTAEKLQNVLGSNWGTANRLMKYACKDHTDIVKPGSSKKAKYRN
ncbi:hypothetical protein GGU11DRAFT_827474 [Lentinula aff. detonsa]|nr:hypothetical protein GGU11DRAFT_827474 [Lentinula aff. detonsa]